MGILFSCCNSAKVPEDSMKRNSENKNIQFTIPFIDLSGSDINSIRDLRQVTTLSTSERKAQNESDDKKMKKLLLEQHALEKKFLDDQESENTKSARRESGLKKKDSNRNIKKLSPKVVDSNENTPIIKEESEETEKMDDKQNQIEINTPIDELKDKQSVPNSNKILNIEVTKIFIMLIKI